MPQLCSVRPHLHGGSISSHTVMQQIGGAVTQLHKGLKHSMSGRNVYISNSRGLQAIQLCSLSDGELTGGRHIPKQGDAKKL